MVVTCVTCSRRLKIANPKLAGTIATCPACGSMVEIPHLQQPAPGVSETGSAANVNSGNGTPKAGGSAAIGGKQIRVGSAVVDSSAVTASSVQTGDESMRVPPDAPSGFSGQDVSGDAAPSNAASTTPEAESGAPPVVGGPAFESSANQRVRKLALVAASALGGIAILGGLTAYWVTRPTAVTSEGPAPLESQDPESDANDSSVADVDPNAAGDANLAKDPDPAGEQATRAGQDDSSPIDSNPIDSNPTDSNPTDLENVANSKSDASAEADLTGVNTTEPDMPDSGANDSAKSDDGVESPNKPPTGLPSLLQTVDPFAAGPDAGVDAAEGDDGPRTDNPDELLKGLEAFDLFVLDEDPAGTTNLDAPPTLEEMRLQAAAAPNGPLLPTQRPAIDVKRDLSLPIAVRSAPRPLGQWTLFFSQLTGVPVELNLVQMDLAGLDAAVGVQPKQTLLPAGDWLDQLVAPLQMRVRAEASQLVVEPNETILSQAIELLTERSDLPDSTLPLQTFLDAVPEPGVDAPNDRLMDADTPVEMKLLAALACESLRRMRGVPGKRDDAVVARWATPLGKTASSTNASFDWPDLMLSGAEAQTLNLPPGLPINLADFLRRTARASGRLAIIDWDDLPSQYKPSELLLPDVQPDPATLLSRTLEPFGLVALKIDSQYFWVSQRSTYDRLSVLVWTDALGSGRAAFERRVASAAAALPAEGLPPSAIRYLYDPTSDRALILLPRFVAGQLR